ncbi:MAG: arginine repressor [Clostridia bacterium]|nr:arginine repressor [Clostridia bacterium]
MKKDRHTIIAELIENNVISTQEDLLRMLNAAGVNVTQATVSRDIKQMRIVKQAAANGVYKYCLPKAKVSDETAKYMAILAGAVEHTDVAMNTVVVKCHAGTAQAACAALDSMDVPELAGTIAGDDTIFAMCYTPEAAVAVRKKLDEIFGF